MTTGELPGGLRIKISKPSSYSFYPVGETVEFNVSVTDQNGNTITSGISAYADLSGPDSTSKRIIMSEDTGNFIGEYTVKSNDTRGIWTVNIVAFNATNSGQASLQLFFTGAYFIQPYTDSRSYIMGETANFTAKVMKPVGSSQPLTDQNLSLNLSVYLFNTTTLVSGPVEMVFDYTTGKFHGDVNTSLLGSGLFSVVFSGNDTDGNIETESLTIGVSEDFNIIVGTDKTYYGRNEPVNIHGSMEFIDGTPLSNTDVNLWISLKGFMRSYTATTNETGGFNYTFQPFAAEAGNYTITSTAVNLGLQRTAENHFTIHGLYLAPPSGTLNMVENSSQDIDFILYNLGETTLTGITAVVNDPDTSDNVDATIVTTVPNELQPSESAYITLNVSAGTPVPENAAFFITVSTDQMSDETSELDVNLFSPNPVVVLEPDNIAVGLNQNQTALKTVTISNTGYGVLRNLTLTQPGYNWMRVTSNTTIGDLKPGENTSFDIHIHSYNVSLGTYHDTVGITSDNHESMVVDLSASITDQTYGSLLFYVENELGQNISGASISLIDDTFYQEYTAITNSTGYALISDLPTGRYIYEVSSSGDNTLSQLNSVVVEPMEQPRRVNVTMQLSFIDFEWDVIPSTIDDWYQIVLNMTFETDVPVPIIIAFPPSLEYNMNPGDIQSGTLTVANLGLVSLFDVSITPYINNNVQFTPIVSHIEELKAKSSVQIPYTIELAPSASSCDGFTGKINIKGKYIHFINGEGVASYTGITVPLVVKTPTCEPPEIGIGTIIGTVTDASDGSQIDNARVIAYSYTDYTDSSGSYTLASVRSGTYTITAYKDGYYPVSKTVVVTKDTIETINFQLTPITTGQIIGIVTNAIDGTPIEGARVAAGGRSDATDDSGSYTLSGVLTGSHTISASKRGFYTSSTTVLVTEDNTAVVNLQLTPIPETVYGSISGTVTDIYGEPLPFALVVTNGGFDFTDESGGYTITGVPVGSNRVRASKMWYHSASKTVHVYEDCTTIVNFQLKKIIIPPIPIPDCESISGTPPVIWVYKGPDLGLLTPPPTTPSKIFVKNTNEEGTIEFSDAWGATISLTSLWTSSLLANVGMSSLSAFDIPVEIWYNEFIPEQIDPNEETMLDVENMGRFFSDMESFGITLPIPDIFGGALGFVYGPYPYDASRNCLKIIPLGGMEIKEGSINIVFPPWPPWPPLPPYPDGDSDDGPGPVPPWRPPVFTETIHEIVQLSISQNATMERDAFWAGLGIRNRMPDTNINNVGVSLHISDENGSANDKFFIRAPRLEDISDIDGSGTISPLQLAKAQWLIIPKPGAGGMSGQTYNISADITYSVDGTNFRVTTENVEILVNPQPQLILDYYLPSDVIGNSPFKLAVMVTNDGYGTAKNFSIETAQPVIYNPSGLMIDFEIIRSALQGEERSNSLKINFGDLSPGESKLAWWEMVVSMDGTFTNFTGEYTHSSELGGMETSLIKELNTNIIHREIETGDVNYSFLVTPKDDETHYLLLDSNSGGSTPVSIANYTIVSGPTPGDPNLDVSIEDLTGQWVIVSIEDPYDNQVPILKVIRDSDGSEIPFYNYWMRDGRILIVDHYIEGFDGNYTIIFKYSNLVPVITTDRTMFDGRIVVEENKAINFSGSDSYDEFGSIVSYKWVFGDGTEKEGENVEHIYSQMGEYHVSLNITNNANVSSQTSVEVYVVKQVVDALVISSDYIDLGWNLPFEAMNNIEQEVANYYFEVSYGAIYLNFTNYPRTITLNRADYINDYEEKPREKIVQDVIEQTIGDATLNQNFVIVATMEVIGARGQAFRPSDIERSYPAAIVPSTNGEFTYGIWAHEIGHVLGHLLENSRRNPSNTFSDDMLWDLYSKGVVKNNGIGNDFLIVNDGTTNDFDIMSEMNLGNIKPPHFTSMSKVLFGWMKTKVINLDDSINIGAIEQSDYGGNTFVYNSVLSNNVQYVIEAREKPEKEVVVYKLEDYDLINDIASPRAGHVMQIDDTTYPAVAINNIWTVNGIILDLGWNFAYFSVSDETENPYSAKVTITTPSNIVENMNGWSVSTIKSIGKNRPPWGVLNESNYTDPDIDLHAYSSDGKHVGVNYTTKFYENEIQGALSSGDLTNGEEWIFAPFDINVSYYISSYDLQQFLEENPDISSTNVTIEYSATFMEYGSNPKLVQLTDDNWIVQNRTVSKPQVESIKPGEVKEIIHTDNTLPSSVINLSSINGIFWINFTWTNPPDPDFNHTELYLNGTFLTNILAPQNYYNATGLLPDTSYELSARTVDTSGNINETWVNDTARTLPLADTTPPIITFIPPTDPGDTTFITRNWTFINISLSEPSFSWLEWNSINESMSGSDTYWYINKTGLDNGVYTYRVWANDSAGNVNVSETRVIEIDYLTDTLPPVVTIISPLNNTTYNTDLVDLNYSVNEPTAWQGYSFDGATNITLKGNTTLTDLIDGLHTLTVYANDTFGNMNSSKVWFTIDATSPIINTASLNTTTPYAGEDILVTVNATDDSAVISVVANDVVLVPQGGYIWSGTITAIAGTHTVNVSATDTAGNIGWNNSTSYTASTQDTIPPFVEMVTLNTTTHDTGEDILVTVNATDNAAVINVEANGVALVSQDGDVWKGTITAMAGTHVVNVSATDAAGNVGWNNSTSYTATTQDTIQPVVEMVILNTTTLDTGEDILVTVNATDNVAVISVVANDIALVPQSGDIWSGTITAIAGTHAVNVSATDTVGNVGWNNSTSYTATTQDTTPPAIISNLHNNSGTTWINWTWTNPPDPDFNHTEIYLNGIFQTNKSAEFFNATGLIPNTEYETQLWNPKK